MYPAGNSTMEALRALALSIPEWNQRLNDLNGQIALRQIELARFTEERPPAARSVRNKGSTESLRPNDNHEDLFFSTDPDHSSEPRKSTHETLRLAPRSNSPRGVTRRAGLTTPPPSKAHSNPRPSPNALTRQSSQPTPPGVVRIAGPAMLKKRKTESLASGESLIPKYRSRSMIIVYYDSAVQTAFEDLVKFVSGSRNAMRKGKMAAKMAEIRKAAELEFESNENNTAGIATDTTGTDGNIEPTTNIHSTSMIPNLQYISTRQMGPGREYLKPRYHNQRTTLSFGMLRGYRRGVDGAAPDIFDELDKTLEWCQSECEKAAHQFLREGDCAAEIDNIKAKLLEVKSGAEEEIERVKKEDSERPASFEPVKSREQKPVLLRRDFGTVMKDLEVDDSLTMEVDEDEGVDDMEIPDLFFKRSRDMR